MSKEKEVGKVIEILTQHNEWRRDKNVPSKTKMQDPKKIGFAIDYAICELKKMLLPITIRKGDKFLCLANYEMDIGDIAYTSGKVYISDLDGCITDNELDINHEMDVELNFFEYFKRVK